MSSYLRSFFVPQPASESDLLSGHPTKSRAHSHQRSNSTSGGLSYIYAPSGQTNGTLRHKRNNSYTTSQPTTPSSLRFATASSERAPVYRSASFKSGEPRESLLADEYTQILTLSLVSNSGPYPKYAPSVSFSGSSRTNSTSSLHHPKPTLSSHSTTSSRSSNSSRHVSFGQARQPRPSFNHGSGPDHPLPSRKSPLYPSIARLLTVI
jgi:hypothetical protein